MCHILSDNRVTKSFCVSRDVSPDCKMCVRDTNTGERQPICYINGTLNTTLTAKLYRGLICLLAEDEKVVYSLSG